MSAVKKMRIAVIEPSPVIRKGIRSLLEENAAELSITDVYGDLQAFQDNRPEPTFDMILLNPAAIHFYKQFNVRNLFTSYPDAVIVALLYGYVDAETLNSFDGAVDIYDDGATMAKKLKGFVKASAGRQGGNNSENAGLSDREKEILIAVAKGMANKEIADKHCISIHTVISHRKNITRKTGIKTVSGLTIYALFNNLVSQEEL